MLRVTQQPLSLFQDKMENEQSRSKAHTPIYNEIQLEEQLFNLDYTKTRLEAIDWDFKDDDTSYLAHGLHPYPCKFIPQIPGNYSCHVQW